MRSDSLGFFWEDLPPAAKKKAEVKKKVKPDPVWLRSDYLPGFSEACGMIFDVYSDQELILAAQNREKLVFDTEIYPNYFLAAFSNLSGKKVLFFEMQDNEELDIAKLNWVLSNFCIIGFNSKNFDIPILTLALAGKNTKFLFWATEQIIVAGRNASDILRELKVKSISKSFNHIDLIEVPPLSASLKLYGGRLHCERMQDLPFKPGTVLSQEQITITRWYCANDLSNTASLFAELSQQITLRESMSLEYGMDLRSKSDAQIAETVLSTKVSELNRCRAQRPNYEPGTRFKYSVPHYMNFQSSNMQWVINLVRRTDFIVSETGNIGMPSELNSLNIPISGSVYKMGIGGLHSTEQKICHIATGGFKLRDVDVESFYPRIILNLRLFPPHLGQNFLKAYESIVTTRITAKHNASRYKKTGEKALEAQAKTVSDSLKITINGAFGKLGSPYSVLYSPNLLIQVTLTGQLVLLLLIERIELAGFNVVSANTDGIVIKYHETRETELDGVILKWEQDTNFITESAFYSALYSRDVNNYIALKTDGTHKVKGVFSEKGSNGNSVLSKNPTGLVCADAVINFLKTGKSIENYITACNDFRRFIFVRTVKGGGVKVYDAQPLPSHNNPKELVLLAGFKEVEGGYWKHEDHKEELSVISFESAYESAKKQLAVPSKTEYLGKNIRWYYAKGTTGEIVYALSGNKVPRSDGAKPCMTLPTSFPDDVDFDWYVAEAYKFLEEIGHSPKSCG